MAVLALNDRKRSLGSELIEVGIHSAELQYKTVKLCAEFDDSHEWSVFDARSAAHWIAGALDVEVSTAREWIRIGKALRNLPLLDEAFRLHRLSYSKIRTLSRFAGPENEGELCLLAEKVPAGRLNDALASWSMRNEDRETIRKRQMRDRGVFVGRAPDGMVTGTFKLPQLEGAKLLAALDASVGQSHASADASQAQQRADALVDLVTSGGAKVDTEVIIHVRGDGTTMDDGSPTDENVVIDLLPTSFIRALIHNADSRPINASGRRRFPSTRQKRVVKERDRCCIDCGSTNFEQYDHVPEFEVSQRTIVDELFLRCSYCHGKRHRSSD